jgi:hypothetical protein
MELNKIYLGDCLQYFDDVDYDNIANNIVKTEIENCVCNELKKLSVVELLEMI